MRITEVKTIRGLEVTTQKLPALRGSALRFRVGKLIGPALATIGGKSLTDFQSMDLSVLGPALSSLDVSVIESLMLETLVCTSVVTTDAGGKQIKFDLTSKSTIDLAFGDDVDALWDTWWFALEVNLRGLFSRGAGLVQPGPTP